MSTDSLVCDPVRALAVAVGTLGAPYRWAAKGPERFDCSGNVTHAVWRIGGPDWRYTHNAQALADMLLPESIGVTGDIAIYGATPRQIVHVMWVTGDGRVFGACGGGSTTLTDEIAKAQGAEVKFRARVEYRSDFLGYRRLQLRQTTAPGAPNA